MKQPLKSITEMGPLVAFFAAYKYYGIIYATGALLAATAVAVAVTYYYMKKVPMVPLVSAVIVGLFGGLTIFSGNDLFIKLKPTLINLLFAGVLFAGVLRGKGLLKHLMDGAMHMSDKAWVEFSKRWAIFFLVLAFANEVVWRNFSTDIWVQFKVFGLLGATFVFMATQYKFISKNVIEAGSKDEKTSQENS